MSDSLIQLLIVSILIILISFIHASKISFRDKYFIILIIALESFSSFLFFREKFNFLLSLSLLLISLAFLFNLSKSVRINELINPFYRLNKNSGYIGDFSFPLGFCISITYLFIEYTILDGRVSINGQLLLIFGIFLSIYNYIPEKYTYEKDFSLMFFTTLLLLFLIPYFLDNIFHFFNKDFNVFRNNVIIVPFLVVPLEAILSILGFNVWGDGLYIFYEDLDSQKVEAVWIAASCSGYYSVVIFCAAFFTYMYKNSETLSLQFLFLLLLGLVMAYLANLFRMAILIIIGHYYGGATLEWTHSNLGWVIFTIWIFIFFKILDASIFNTTLLEESNDPD